MTQLADGSGKSRFYLSLVKMASLDRVLSVGLDCWTGLLNLHVRITVFPNQMCSNQVVTYINGLVLLQAACALLTSCRLEKEYEYTLPHDVMSSRCTHNELTASSGCSGLHVKCI